MVSKAIDEGLLVRIQTYVARDINSKEPVSPTDPDTWVDPKQVYIPTFTRVLNSWQAEAVVFGDPETIYIITHDGSTNRTVVNLYQKTSTQEAII